MTCVWRGILRELSTRDRQLIMGSLPATVPNLIISLKRKNLCVTNVRWQGQRISHRLSNEHYKHIHAYNPNDARNGYLMSSCDAFLVLLAHVLHANIKFDFAGNIIQYSIPGSSRTLNFRSSTSHFF